MSGKAGVSWPCQEGTSDPLLKFFGHGSKLSWHWNWNKNYKSCLPRSSSNLQINAEFVPMIFAPDHLANGVEVQEGYRLVMGFNEPDHGDAAVAYKCSPEQAAAAWTDLARLRHDDSIKLASPAVAANIDWLREFFSLIPEASKPDYLTVHLYTTSFDDFVRRIDALHREFQLPMVLSEFAMHSFDPSVPPPISQQQVHDFLGQTTKWLDETAYIHKYSWFGAVRDEANLHGVNPYNRLMDAHGDLTPLGWQYIHGGHD